MNELTYNQLVKLLENNGVELSGNENYSELLRMYQEDLFYEDDSLEELDFE